MDKNRRRNLKSRKSLPDHDIKETEALMDLLFVACKENNAQCARLMDVNRKTWLRWTKETPTGWYYPMILRFAIKHTLAAMIAQRRTTSRKFQQSILDSLSKIPRSTELEEEISTIAYEARGCQRHLRELLQTGGKYWSVIQNPGNCGGYSRQMLRIAAKQLGVVKRQEGFGADKDSFWRLPNEDED